MLLGVTSLSTHAYFYDFTNKKAKEIEESMFFNKITHFLWNFLRSCVIFSIFQIKTPKIKSFQAQAADSLPVFGPNRDKLG